MKAYQTMKDLGREDRTALDAACGACRLDAKPMREAHIVMELAMRPDALLDFERMPYWMVAGITTYRAMTRSVF